MNWDAIGAVSDAIGAASVVVTLAFLSLQIRQNSKLIRSQIEGSEWSQYAHALGVQASSSQASALLVKGFRSMAGLTEEERIQFLSLCILALNAVEHQLRQMDEPLPDADADMLWSIAKIYVGTPGGREFWSQYRSSFTARFITWLDARLKQDAAGNNLSMQPS